MTEFLLMLPTLYQLSHYLCDIREHSLMIQFNFIKATFSFLNRSEQASRKTRQLETCLRQLQHLVTSSYIAPSLDVQAKVLTLFHRLAFFKVNKKVKGIQHVSFLYNLFCNKWILSVIVWPDPLIFILE